MKNVLFILIVTLTVSCKPVEQESSSQVIQLTKKRCLGKCPVYDVIIKENGLLSYHGIDHVEKKGKHEFKISEKELQELKLLFLQSKFKELKKPIHKGRDLPITRLSYHHKTVSFQGQNMPGKIKEIINKIETMVKK
jgi:hypothetical protein